jgi:tetratricopeptide (TPR) repeat protein
VSAELTRTHTAVNFTPEPAGSVTLSGRDKEFSRVEFLAAPFYFRRRDFLIQASRTLSGVIIAPHLQGFAAFDAPSVASPFHLQPHYRMPSPLDPVLLQTEPGHDEFVYEKHAAQVSAILSGWSASLRHSPQEATRIENFLAPGFSAAPLAPAHSQVIRPGPPIEIRRNTFDHSLSRTRAAFLQELGAWFRAFSTILTADFQITAISGEPSDLRTSIRYELVGSVPNAHREQRVGFADLAWQSTSLGEFRLLSWKMIEETESRSTSRVYADITTAALGADVSFAAQLQHGSDYWRTVLDAACGIDIYGHNGVSVGDIDGDGLDDLYVCQPGGLPNRLFRNRGDGTFEDVTRGSGVGVIENTACALFADINNDGRQDLIVVRANGPILFLNDGNGKFHQQPNAFNFATPPQGTFTGAAIADYDRDGWLDIYFCLYVYYQGASQYKYPSPYHDANNGPPNFLMRNNRNGTFRDVTAESGMNLNNTRYSFCCAWNDFNRDGWPDLYVVNDFGRKNLYRNNGNGTFTDVAAEAGVEDVGAGMSVAWFDYNNDGTDDLYVANMWTAAGERITMQEKFKTNSSAQVRAQYHKHAMGNSLFESASVTSVSSVSSNSPPDRKFSDTTDASETRVGRWAWSSDAFDFDHDGLPDLYVTNGMVSAPGRDDLNSFFWRQVVAKSPDESRPSHDYEQGWTAINELIRSDRTWSGYERNIFYANNGDGTFSDISGAVGLDFLEDGRSFAVCDFDQDGRQEIFLKNRNAPQLRILKNVLPELPPSISFRLRGTKSNRDAIGAVIKLETGKGIQTRSVQAGSGFLSQHSKEVFFGLGKIERDKQPAAAPLVKATVRWPSGLVQEFPDLPINHRIWIEEGAVAPARVVPFRAISTPEPGAENPQPPESLPETAETWLLAPVSAPDFSLPKQALRSHPERSDGFAHANPSAQSKDPYPTTNSEGERVILSRLRGNPVLLSFGAAGEERSRQSWIALNDRAQSWSQRGLHLLAMNVDDTENLHAFLRDQKVSFPILQGNDDVAAVYNIAYRYIFDRHRDLAIPTSFLIDAKGDIVKIYQGPADPVHVEQDFRSIPQKPAERLVRALPFPGVTEVVEFGRNYLSFGSVFFQRGYLEEAAAAFEIALRDDPDSAEAAYGIGSVLLNQGSNAEAKKYFERALKMRAAYPDTLANAWNNLGLIAGREGDTGEAVAYFLEALRLSPDHRIALNNLGGAYRQQKKWELAKKTYERSLSLNSSDADATYGLGMIYAQLDDTTRAFDLLQQALKLRPDYPEALNNLGILYLRTQRRDDGVASFEQAIRIAPDFDQPYLNLARVHVIEGDKEAARAILQKLLVRNPNHSTARQMLSEIGQ